MVRRYFFGKDYGQDERIIAAGPGDLYEVYTHPRVRLKGFSCEGRVSKISNRPV